MLLFIDNIFASRSGFGSVGTMGRMPSCSRLSTEPANRDGEMQERITSTKTGSNHFDSSGLYVRLRLQ